jgi:hypothetical protein
MTVTANAGDRVWVPTDYGGLVPAIYVRRSVFPGSHTVTVDEAFRAEVRCRPEDGAYVTNQVMNHNGEVLA